MGQQLGSLTAFTLKRVPPLRTEVHFYHMWERKVSRVPEELVGTGTPPEPTWSRHCPL